VKLEEDGVTVFGQGADADTMVASCRAYIHALNKLLAKRGQKQKRDDSTVENPRRMTP
jgi:hypothetical protein